MPFLDENGLKRVWSKMLDKMHPVGSLYWSSNSTNPGTLFGGTWVQIKDKFILAAGDKYGNGTTGGSADAVVVSHTHSIPALSGKTTNSGDHAHSTITIEGSGTYTSTQVLFPTNNAGYTGIAVGGNKTINIIGGAHTHSVTTNASTTGSQGASGAGKNMPPYETYYCWKRTK